MTTTMTTTMTTMTTMYGTMCLVQRRRSVAKAGKATSLVLLCVDRHRNNSRIRMESQSNTAASQPAMNFLASAQAGEAEKVPLREIQVRLWI